MERIQVATPGMGPQAERVFADFESEQAALEHLGREDYAQAREALEDLARGSADSAPVVAEILPVLDALAVDEHLAALMRLVYETTYDSRIEDRLHETAVRGLEARREWPIAAAGWLAWRDPRGADRARWLMERYRIEEELPVVALADAAVSYYQGRTDLRPNDVLAWENLATNLHTLGRTDEALAAAEQAASLEGARPRTTWLMASLLTDHGRVREAVDLLVSVSRDVPEAWPLLQLADILSRVEDHQGALRAVRAAVDRSPGDWQTLSALRVQLRNVELWEELVRVLELLMGLTLRADVLASLHREVADILSSRLSSPADAVKELKRADWYMDLQAVAEWYWNAWRQNPEDHTLLREMEEFFRVNSLGAHLAELLHLRIQRVHRLDEMVRLLDDLTRAYVTSVADPDWDRLLAELDAAIDRTSDPATAARLQARVRLIHDVYAEGGGTDEAEIQHPSEEGSGRAMLVIAVGLLLVLAAILVALLIS